MRLLITITMAKFLDLDGLSTLVSNIASFVEMLVTNLTTGKFMPALKKQTFNEIAPGVLWYYTQSSTSSAYSWFRLGVAEEGSTTTYNSYVYLSKSIAQLRCKNTYINLQSTGIKIYVNGTGYTLNVAKAKELGVLS